MNLKNENLKIVMYPHSESESNPYIDLLADALEEKGCKIWLQTRVDKTIPFHLIKNSRNSNILHLHWISGLYSGKTRIRFLIRTLLLIITLLVIRLRGIRIIWTLHNLIPHDVELLSFHVFARRLIAKCIHKIIVHSVPAKKEAIKCLGSKKKFQVILHGHYRDVYPNNISRKEAKIFLRIPSNKKVVLFFGAIKPYKGLENVIFSFKGYCKDLILLIAGNGESDYINILKKSLPLNVILHTEFIPNDKVQYYMNAADCLILPYRQNLTSGAAVLGLTFGLPIVCSNTVAFKHLINKKLCVPCDIGSPQSIYMAIQDILLFNREIFKKKCDDFLIQCSWNRIAEEHMKVYKIP